MKSFSRRHKGIAAFVGLMVLCLLVLEAWNLVAPLRGQVAGQFDVRHGHYRLLTYGLPPSEFAEYANILEERYGVHVQAVTGCIVSEPLKDYVDSYDDVSFAAANRKFGHDIFKEAWQEAQHKFGLSDESTQLK